jgi:hypothetical protein
MPRDLPAGAFAPPGALFLMDRLNSGLNSGGYYFAVEELRRRIHLAGSNVIHTCPFCEAPWGECDHVRLLISFVKEAEAREAVNTQFTKLGLMPREEPGRSEPGES